MDTSDEELGNAWKSLGNLILKYHIASFGEMALDKPNDLVTIEHGYQLPDRIDGPGPEAVLVQADSEERNESSWTGSHLTAYSDRDSFALGNRHTV